MHTEANLTAPENGQISMYNHHFSNLVDLPSLMICLFVLRFYSPVNPMGSCRAWLVYLTTRLLGKLSPPSS